MDFYNPYMEMCFNSDKINNITDIISISQAKR